MGIDLDVARTTVGILGNAISLFLFLSPVPTFYKIWKAKSVQSFKPDPYVATVVNCALWIFYGMPFVHPDSLLVITINGTGLFIEAIYVIIYMIYTDWRKRRLILIAILVEFVFMCGVVVVTILCLHTTKTRSLLVGLLCVIFNVVMYAAPLTVMSRVIKTKSVKFLPFYLALANFANGIVWTAYALIKFDPYVLVPNGLGTLSGLAQLLLYATFYKSTKWEEDETARPQVQLQPPAANPA
ncbi:Bidirectional sugar transporter sweet5 [Castilleja foliolosa]|uniref:Bidirectional sugar transporter SWEET n=1 Tax=Castilleja foliolosa TaxID=1961234 RepID=A0ABD3DK30_9LAMI